MSNQTQWNTLIGMDTEAPFWFVWNPRRNAPTHRHPTHEAACKEAERLARLHPKEPFHVLEAKGCCVFDPQPVSWVKVNPDWVPF